MHIKELCQQEGIELRGEELHPFHCGQHMTVGHGIIGPDSAECKVCGLEIVDLASPHINGAYRRGSALCGIEDEDLWINPEKPEEDALQRVGLTSKPEA